MIIYRCRGKKPKPIGMESCESWVYSSCDYEIKKSLFRKLNSPIDSLIVHELWHWWHFLVDCYPFQVSEHTILTNKMDQSWHVCLELSLWPPSARGRLSGRGWTFSALEYPAQVVFSPMWFYWIDFKNIFSEGHCLSQQWHVILQICYVTYEKAFRNN